MQELSTIARLSLYPIIGVMGVLSILIFAWQILVLKGKAMKNCDGSYDNWHEQKTHYGMAVADVFVACPAVIAGIILIYVAPRWGFYLLALTSFWWVWANVMTTATSLRFEKPKITLVWFLTYPFGSLIGLAYIGWSIIHFQRIYAM
jgi:hypothetical protein